MAKSFALINFRQKKEEIDYILNEVMYRDNQSIKSNKRKSA
jgi:hypothetical protein